MSSNNIIPSWTILTQIRASLIIPGHSSDSLFSLIIFIYVSVTFLYMFYAFCWREEHPDMSRMANMAMSQQTQDMEIGDSEDSDLENGNGAIKMQVTAA